MSERYKVTPDLGRYRAEFFGRTGDGLETYGSATFTAEAAAWAWVERRRRAAPSITQKSPPVYEITPTDAGTYRVTIAGRGLDQAESLGEFSKVEEAQTFIGRMEVADRAESHLDDGWLTSTALPPE